MCARKLWIQSAFPGSVYNGVLVGSGVSDGVLEIDDEFWRENSGSILPSQDAVSMSAWVDPEFLALKLWIRSALPGCVDNSVLVGSGVSAGTHLSCAKTLHPVISQQGLSMGLDG